MEKRPAESPRVLATGGTGFVGGYMGRELVRRFPLSARCTLARRVIEGPQSWAQIVADVTVGAAVSAAIRDFRPDIIVHLAAQSSVRESGDLSQVAWRVNLVGALNVAAAAAEHAPEATVINISSGEVYGASFLNGPASESTPLAPLSVYARSKAAAESVFEDVLGPRNCLVTLRPFNHSGPGQDERFVLASFAAQIARIEAAQQPPKLRVGNLDVERDFLDVRDVVDAYLLVIEGALRLPLRAVYNVASSKPRRIGDLLNLMIAAAKCTIKNESDPNRQRVSEIKSAVGLCLPLRNTFGWAPKRSLEELVLSLLEFWRKQVSDDRP